MVNVGNPSVVVDDQSPQVQYTGSWGKGGSAPEFTGTTSYALAKGATATFRFDGELYSSRINIELTSHSQARPSASSEPSTPEA